MSTSVNNCVNNSVRIKLANPENIQLVPKRATPGSVGADLCSSEDLVILPGQRRLVDVGFSMAFEGPYYARIAPRSGLAAKFCVDVGAGVIDSDYRGPVKVLLINNHPTNNFQVKFGDRIAQMIIEQVALMNFVPVEGELDSTERGEGGFGSTGSNLEQITGTNSKQIPETGIIIKPSIDQTNLSQKQTDQLTQYHRD